MKLERELFEAEPKTNKVSEKAVEKFASIMVTGEILMRWMRYAERFGMKEATQVLPAFEAAIRKTPTLRTDK